MKFPALSLPSLRMPSLPPLLRPRFTRAEWIFSLKAFAGAMLAVCLASWAGQPHPFWAMMTAYIVANPMAGAVRSKAVFRFCGTLVGGTAAVLLVPRFAHAPELLSLALALWVAGCLTLSLHDRTPRAYAFMLAGYTAALIGFPSGRAVLDVRHRRRPCRGNRPGRALCHAGPQPGLAHQPGDVGTGAAGSHAGRHARLAHGHRLAP